MNDEDGVGGIIDFGVLPDEGVVHTPGLVLELVQRCVRCGVVLSDYRGAQSAGDWSPAGWSVEANVQVSDGATARFTFATMRPATCTARIEAKTEAAQ